MTSLPAVRRATGGTGRVAATDPAAFERELIDLALAGAGWPELLERLTAATGRATRLLTADGAVLAGGDAHGGLSRACAETAHHPEAQHQLAARVRTQDGWTARALPARAGGRVVALLLIAAPAAEAHVALARAAVTAVLIESVRRSATGASRFGDGAALIGALRRGVGDGAGDRDGVRLAATRFGLDLDRPHCAAALAYAGRHTRTWATALSWLERPVEHHGECAYTLVADADDLTRTRERLELTLGAGTVLAASGPDSTLAGGYATSFAEAAALLAHLRRAGTAAPLSFADAGLLQVLLAVPQPRLAYFARRHLGPLLDRPELLATLRLWLASGGSRQVVSEQLHLHRNSVGYRVGQLKTLLGVDPVDPACSAVLHAALVALDLLNEGESPYSERELTAADGSS
jgi:PucR-like helix-turn-helix protein